jgi:hypothetical protein
MVRATAATQQDIGRMLGIACTAWESLPEVEAEIDGWDLLQQIDFVEEWTLEEERLKWLERYRADGLLTTNQVARHDDLKRLVAQNRPIIERLRAS